MADGQGLNHLTDWTCDGVLTASPHPPLHAFSCAKLKPLSLADLAAPDRDLDINVQSWLTI